MATDDDDLHGSVWLLVELRDDQQIAVRTARNSRGDVRFYQDALLSDQVPCVLLEQLIQQDETVFTLEYDEFIFDDMTTDKERNEHFAKKRLESRVIQRLKAMYPSIVWDMGGDTGDEDDQSGGYHVPTLTFHNVNELVLFKLYW